MVRPVGVAQPSAEFVTTSLQLKRERERAEGPLEGRGMYPLYRTGDCVHKYVGLKMTGPADTSTYLYLSIALPTTST